MQTAIADKLHHGDGSIVYYPYISTLMFFMGSLVYCAGIVSLAKESVWFEFAIAVLFLMLALPFFKRADNWGDVKRLIILETGFNLISIGAKLAPIEGKEWAFSFDILFASFFILQVSGFVLAQASKNKWECIPASVAMGVGLLVWYLNGETTRITDSGGLHIWGSDAPGFLQLMYLFWVANVLLVENKSYLPKLTLVVVHLASVCVAFMSDEFFHARILTASHLFVLNCLFMYKSIGWCGREFGMIPVMRVFSMEGKASTILAMFMNVSCIITLVFGLATY